MYSQFYYKTGLLCNYREQLCTHKIMVPLGLQWQEMFIHQNTLDIQIVILFGKIYYVYSTNP